MHDLVCGRLSRDENRVSARMHYPGAEPSLQCYTLVFLLISSSSWEVTNASETKLGLPSCKLDGSWPRAIARSFAMTKCLDLF